MRVAIALTPTVSTEAVVAPHVGAPGLITQRQRCALESRLI